MNGLQSRKQTSRKTMTSRAALWPRESHTAAVKRAQSHTESSSLAASCRSLSKVDDDGKSEIESRERERIERVSARV